MKELIFFWQENCLPCDQVKPIIEKLEAAGWPVRHFDAKDERNKYVLSHYRVKSTPTLVLAEDGKRAVGWVGGLISFDAVMRFKK